MRKFKIETKRQWIIVVVAALVLALIAELGVFMTESRASYAEDSVSLMDASEATLTPYGYNVSGNAYTQVLPDPQLSFRKIDETFEYVLVSFASPVYTDARVEVYYCPPGEEFTAENAIKQRDVPFAATHMVLQIPEGEYEGLRVDIDGKFALADIVVSADPIRVNRVFADAFNVLRVLAVFAVAATVGLLWLWWVHKPKTLRRLSKAELLFLCACFAYYALWAVSKPLEYAPDEAMRYDVTLFLFEHNRLPVGDELLHDVWGFSYAHFPTVLCNELGYLFMKAASVFMSGDFKMLVAARMVSVCAGTGVIYYVIKITRHLFRSPARWVMIVFIAFMPQFAFLSSYVNNDSLAMLGAAMIVYAWVLALKYRWEWSSAALLAVGVATCGLSYYNSYSWILMSIIFFVVTYWLQNRKDYKGLAIMFGVITAIVVAIIGYSFIRHVVLYGDLLGFKTRRFFGELYAVESHRPSVAGGRSPQDLGVSFMQMMSDKPYEYLKKTWQSFVGVFGSMTVFCPDKIYDVMLWIVRGGIIGLAWKLIDAIIKKKRPHPKAIFLWSFMIIAGLISIGLAVYKSYTGDFQPQGRYCYPAIIPIAFLLTQGYEALIKLFKRKEHQYAITAVGCTAFAALSYYVFSTVFLPS